MTLEDAIANCHIFTFEGLLASTIDDAEAGTIEFDAVATDGLAYAGVFLAKQEITIDDNGAATITDLDGDTASVRFYVPMKS
jgi:hypothetical protein